MNIISVNNITKDFGNKKGVFDLTLNVEKGEVYGFLGPNGAGKTTTIRALLGFIRPDCGNCTITVPDNSSSGHSVSDCFQQSAIIQKHLGYLAGEIAFIDDMSGDRLLNFLADMKGLKDRKRMLQLIDMFELNASGNVKKMSKGMKQKIGIVNAFMTNPEILILDEPTSGLDPLMQNRFVELILEEKKKGTTILMSSHMFEEVERTCDKTAIINAGKLVAVEKLDSLKQRKNKKYIVTFSDSETASHTVIEGFKLLGVEDTRAVYSVGSNVQDFINKLSKCKIVDLSVESPTLEEMFMHFYNENSADN